MPLPCLLAVSSSRRSPHLEDGNAIEDLKQMIAICVILELRVARLPFDCERNGERQDRRTENRVAWIARLRVKRHQRALHPVGRQQLNWFWREALRSDGYGSDAL